MSEFKVLCKLDKKEIFKPGPPISMSTPRALYVMHYVNHKLIIPKNLRYFKIPPQSWFPLDLNVGYEDYTYRIDEDFSPNLNKMEKFLMENNGRSLLQNKSKQQFCTSRNVLKTIMMTPYRLWPSKFNDWRFKIIKFGDVIYMCKDEKYDLPHKKTLPNTYHFKFQQYCLSDSPFTDPVTDKPVNENHQFSCVFRSSIEDFEIYYAAEIAGVESTCEIKDFNSETTLNGIKFVLTKLLTPDLDSWINKSIILQGWVQSYLAGTDTIFQATRTKEGFVNVPPQRLHLDDLPKGQTWKPEICKRFLQTFLFKIATKLENVNCPYTTYEVNFNSEMKTINLRVIEGKSEESFLTEEFINYMKMK